MARKGEVTIGPEYLDGIIAALFFVQMLNILGPSLYWAVIIFFQMGSLTKDQRKGLIRPTGGHSANSLRQ